MHAALNDLLFTLVIDYIKKKKKAADMSFVKSELLQIRSYEHLKKKKKYWPISFHILLHLPASQRLTSQKCMQQQFTLNVICYKTTVNNLAPKLIMNSSCYRGADICTK